MKHKRKSHYANEYCTAPLVFAAVHAVEATLKSSCESQSVTYAYCYSLGTRLEHEMIDGAHGLVDYMHAFT